MPRLVIIDPNEAERRSIAASFTLAGFDTLQASSGVEGLLQVVDAGPDLIILAEEMPPLQSADLLVILRRAADVPIIIIGGGGDPEEIVALESGADSYVRRGASIRLLRARAGALLRRRPRGQGFLACLAPIPIPISLTATERRLLACLSNHSGRPVSLGDLRVEVWGESVGMHAVKYCLRCLRHKMKTEPCGVDLLCIRGIGYRLVSSELAGLAPCGHARMAPSARAHQPAGVA
jgi:DNA-binding response OmpR family regulator